MVMKKGRSEAVEDADLVRPLDAQPLRVQVAERTERMIAQGRFRPGDRLREEELASLLQVSRGPIREALQLLERDGWVIVRPRQGAVVRRRTAKEITDLFNLRQVLEIHAAGLAAETIDAKGSARLKELMTIAETAARRGTIGDLLQANAAVHSYVSELSGNLALIETVQSVARRLKSYIFTPHTLAPARARQTLAEHRSLTTAILAKKPQKARKAMEEHTNRTRYYFEKWMKEASQDHGVEPYHE